MLSIERIRVGRLYRLPEPFKAHQAEIVEVLSIELSGVVVYKLTQRLEDQPKTGRMPVSDFVVLASETEQSANEPGAKPQEGTPTWNSR